MCFNLLRHFFKFLSSSGGQQDGDRDGLGQVEIRFRER
jgi:hypothetical protein